MWKQKNLERIAQRANAAGYRHGEHAAHDKLRGRTKFEKATLATQDQTLAVYLVWCSNAYDVPLEECAARFLSKDSSLPEVQELKDFWRFYALQSHGRIRDANGSRTKCPSAKTLKGKAKAWKAGFLRLTHQKLNGEDTEEINRWLQNDLPYEATQEGRRYCINIQRPKYNLQPEDLNRLIDQIWCGKDSQHIHDRNRLQFHFLLLLFCHSGARRNALLGCGVPYKDIQLVLESRQDGPSFFFNLKQRHVKNNKDPDNRCFGSACIQHPVLRYDSVSILLTLAVFDGALNPNDLTRMLENGGSGQVQWNERCRDLPICRSVNHNGDVHDMKPMTESTFMDMFKMFFMQAGYTDVPGSIHMIRREVGKQIDKRYTEVERSQHLTQADKAVFGQSYTADISSCDGMSAFLREKPDHRAVEYFQGLTQFRQEGLPTQLPAALKEEVSRDAELLVWDQIILQADGNIQNEARQKRQKVLRRLEKRKLEEYRRECSSRLMKENLFNGRQATNSDPHPLHKLRPEIGRLAEKMIMVSPASQQDRNDAMHDMQSLLAAPPVFYRQHEEPVNGRCSYCSEEMQSITDKRSRCKHIHRCRRKAIAAERSVLRETLKFCYFCNLFFDSKEYPKHCEMHLTESLKYCGSITYRHTLVHPAFCLLCRQSKRKPPATRMQFFDRDIKAIRHMETDHKEEWPWSCPGCNFLGENSKSCYHHLHDAHGYELMPEDKQGIRDSNYSPVIQSHEPTDQPTPSDSWLPSLLCSEKQEGGLTQSGIVNDSLATPDCLSSTVNLSLSSTAKHSLALLGVCPWDILQPNKRSPTLNDKGVQDPVRNDSIQCDISPLSIPYATYAGNSNASPPATPSAPVDADTGESCMPTPCAPDDNTGSMVSDASASQSNRMELTTAACRSEVGDIKPPPALKKPQIKLIIRPRNVREKEHDGGDSTAVQAQLRHQTEIEKPTKTRIILKTSSCQPECYRPATTLRSWLPGAALSRRKWTSEEDEMICTMKQDKTPWVEIQRALPHRSLGSLQVRYSTKLKKRKATRSEGREVASGKV
ncbi:hypothetical protein FPRO03_03459 [Fusarium proliferatum]|nr:hypothetical protein FPRO03_03459 [Fusarium proliferatum]